jgi:mono/diheme cytochrome c family protein
VKAVVLGFALLALVACDNGGATPDWSRMITQPKLLPFGTTSQFADGAAMRPVPAGTIARDWIADGAVRDGRTVDGAPVDVIPPAITRPLLERGRERFDIVCAACHGIAGDGDSAVARNMQRRRPPSLHEPRLVALSPGELYRTIVEGYGLMPSYAAMIDVDDRWAIIAYTRTLQRAWQLDVQTLPPATADDLARRLP